MMNSAQQQLVKLQWLLARYARGTERTLAMVLELKQMAREQREQAQATVEKLLR